MHFTKIEAFKSDSVRPFEGVINMKCPGDKQCEECGNHRELQLELQSCESQSSGFRHIYIVESVFVGAQVQLSAQLQSYQYLTNVRRLNVRSDINIEQVLFFHSFDRFDFECDTVDLRLHPLENRI